jgi:hypothetical protein
MHIAALLPNANDALESRFREDPASGKSFTELIGEVLGTDSSGPRVSLMLWNKLRGDVVSRSLLVLMAKMSGLGRGQLDIRVSGTTEGQEDVVPFIVAFDDSRKSWALWLEVKGQTEFPSSAGVIMPKKATQLMGPQLLAVFSRIFEAADREPSTNERLTISDT